MIQVPLNDPAVLSSLQGLQGVQQRFDREAQRIAQPAQAEPGAEGEDGDGEPDAETFVDALVVQPDLYRANARTLRTADETLGSLLDVLA